MIRDLLLAYARSMGRDRLSAALGILALAVGIAAFLILTQFVRQETSYEGWLDGSEKVYAVEQTWTFPGAPPERTFSTMGNLVDVLRAELPNVEATRVMDIGATMQTDGTSRSEPMRLADPNFFSLFPFPLLEGDPVRALSSPDGVVVSRELADRYLGPGPALGKRLPMTVDGDRRLVRVSAVLAAMPRQTEMETSLLARFDPKRADPARFENWGSGMVKSFVRLKDRADTKTIEDTFERLVATRATRDVGPTASKNLQLRLMPLAEVHVRQAGLERALVAVGLVGALALLVACFNYVTLMTARATLRAKEIAVRKICGATRGQLIVQFLAESLATAVLAAVIALAIVELALPSVNRYAGSTISISYTGAPSVLPTLAVAVLALSCAGGLYAALVMSRFPPSLVLASSRMPGGGRSAAAFRAVLVGLQYALVMLVALATAVVLLQTRYLRSIDVGFERSRLIVVPSTRDGDLSADQRRAFVEQARTVPGVIAATQANAAPGDEDFSQSGAVARPGETAERASMRVTTIGDRFFATYAINLLAGRALDSNHAADDITPVVERAAATANVAIDRAAARRLGFGSPQDAIGKMIELDTASGRNALRVVGVTENIRFRSPSAAPNPTVFLFRARDIPHAIAAVRTDGNDAAVTARLTSLWRGIAGGVPFEAATAQARLAPYYLNEDRLFALFLMGAAVALMLGSMGLYAMTLFSTTRRTREIGLRKALGASTADVLWLQGRQSLQPIVVALLIACPIGYLLMNRWLSGFDQRIGLGAATFLVVGFVVLTTAVATIFAHVYAAARRDPAQALNHD